jgi:choline dehydrogenase-like flavoprotein
MPEGAEAAATGNGIAVDATAFPSPSGTNPMLTIMALARRTAHAIAAA